MFIVERGREDNDYCDRKRVIQKHNLSEWRGEQEGSKCEAEKSKRKAEESRKSKKKQKKEEEAEKVRRSWNKAWRRR